MVISPVVFLVMLLPTEMDGFPVSVQRLLFFSTRLFRTNCRRATRWAVARADHVA
jgi:hypothetical protein